MRQIAVLSALMVAGASASTSAQSLGDVAAREAKRRLAIAAPSRVVTNDDLKDASAPPPDMTPAAPAPPAAADPGRPRMAFTPAVFKSGELPPVSLQAMGGGEVTLEVSVNKEGGVEGVTVLRQTPPFTDALVAAVKSWTFSPAEDVATPEAGAKPDPATKRPVDSKVLVMGLFRPPSLFPGTLGEVPKTVGKASEAAAAPTGAAAMPAYPPNALFDGVVLAELKLSASGAIEQAGIVRSAPGFDEPTLDAAKKLTFRPPQVHGRPSRSNAYVVAMFRQPITP